MLKYEELEDRRLLAGIKADIVFLVDESTSQEDGADVQGWLTALVTGDVNKDGDNSDPEDILSLPERLNSVGVDDIRFGLVGYGEDASAIARHAHSQLFDTDFSGGAAGTLFGDPTLPLSEVGDTSVETADLNAIFDANLQEDGGLEDGWDAIEHAIAEYNFREGAIPAFVLVHGDEGRVNLNETLTHDGILAALKSKNAILNSMIVGRSEGLAFEWERLANLTDYGQNADIRVLGIEADVADGVADRQHKYHWVDTDTFNSTTDTITATVSNAMQISYNGSNTGATGMVATGKSVVIGQNVKGGIGGVLPSDLVACSPIPDPCVMRVSTARDRAEGDSGCRRSDGSDTARSRSCGSCVTLMRC